MPYALNISMKKILACLFLFCSINATSQPIEFVVSASPGGPNDTVTRMLAEKITQNSDIKLIILNRPGAAHVIGYNHVLNANKPTLLMSTSEIMNHEVYNQVDEIFNAGYFTNILFVSEKLGIKSFNQLIELSKQREILFGSGGHGTFSYTAMETVCKSVLRCLSVPYKSGSEGMLAVMSNQIDAYAVTSYGANQYLENSKLVAIHEIKVANKKGWFKLFAKNVSEKDKATIVNILKSQDPKFYKDMGFEK